MFAKLLIANRGEIACRVMRTARRLGIRTVAVYSEADANALHVAMADEAVLLGPAPARDSYLAIDRLVDVMHRTGAEAVHPGYGFLSENAEFALACAEAGVTFVGPPVAAIRAMGSKSEAKTIMGRAGVPLVPGYHGDDQADATLLHETRIIGFPVLLKAVAGGGGKGMRRVDDEAEFPAALAGARREAEAAFADDRMLVERLVRNPRHVEVQVFADTQGNVVHLFERDCSIQRRHQKVVEEAPAPGLSPERRAAFGAAAVKAAKAIGYVGAGTVEFLLAPDQEFYFMEMNTRLQVEHPVTEMITGLDLVEWQLRVAAGGALPLAQHRIVTVGHAMEVRIYAEDPDRGFLPATGRLVHVRWPDADRHVRVDTGIREGDEISVHYDPMIAKLIVWDADRPAAVGRLRVALAHCQLAGLRSNLEFLSRIAGHAAFAAGSMDTGFIERHQDELVASGPSVTLIDVWTLACIDVLLHQEEAARSAASVGHDPWSPWSDAKGWRLNGDGHSEIQLRHGDAVHRIRVTYCQGGYLLELPMGPRHVRGRRLDGRHLRIDIEGRQASGTVVRDGATLTVFAADGSARFELVDAVAHGAEVDAAPGHLRAPMPGKVIQVNVRAGDKVQRGTVLLVLEAMKMEHSIAAPAEGTVARVFHGAGDLVSEGAELVSFAEEPA